MKLKKCRFGIECDDTDHFWFVCNKCNKEAEIKSVGFYKSGTPCINFFLICNCGNKGSRKIKNEALKDIITKGERPGIGKRAKELIMQGEKFQEIYNIIYKEFPGTKFSKKCYYWYRSHLYTDEGKVPPKIK